MEKAFLHGLILALGLILPLGVQNLFIIQQGMMQKKLIRALPAVCTAAASDTVLITIAVSGVSLLFVERPLIKMMLCIGGALFLVYMGWKSWHSEENCLENGNAKELTPKEQIMFALSVSLLNPYALLDLFGVIGIGSLQYSGAEKLSYTTATILVSWVWFSFLSIAGHTLRKAPESIFKPIYLQRFAAVFIWCSAGYLVYSLI